MTDIGTEIEEIVDDVEEEVEKTIDEYKQFAFKNNLVNMTIAFVLGAATGKVIESITESIVMPLVDFVIFKTGGGWRTRVWTPLVGLTFEVGKSMAASIEFALITIVLFIMWKFAKKVMEQDTNDLLQK